MATLISPLVVLGLDSASVRILPGQPLATVRSGFASFFLFVICLSAAAAVALILSAEPLAAVFFGGRQNAPFVELVAGVLATSCGLSGCKLLLQVLTRTRGMAAMT